MCFDRSCLTSYCNCEREKVHRLSPDRISGLHMVWSFIWAGFTLRHPDWRVFTFTPWISPKSKFQVAFLIYRWIIALLFTGCYALGVEMFTTSYLADVGSWCMLLRVVYFWWSAVVVTMTHFHCLRHRPILQEDIRRCKASHCGLDQDTTSWYHKVQWCLAKISGDFSIVAVYWVLLTSNWRWTPDDYLIYLHVGIALVFFVDEFIGYIPFRFFLIYVDILAIAVFSHIHILIHCDVLVYNATNSIFVDELDLHDSRIVSDKCSLVHSIVFPMCMVIGAHFIAGFLWTCFREWVLTHFMKWVLSANIFHNRIHPQPNVASQENLLAEVSLELRTSPIQQELSTEESSTAVSPAVKVRTLPPGVYSSKQIKKSLVDRKQLFNKIPTISDETPLDSILGSSSPVVEQAATELSPEHSTGIRKRGVRNGSSPEPAESKDSKDDSSPKRKHSSPVFINVGPLEQSSSDEPNELPITTQQMDDVTIHDIESTVNVVGETFSNVSLEDVLTTTQASAKETPAGLDENKQEEATGAVQCSTISSDVQETRRT